MALFRWEEITTKAWIFSLALVVLVVWFAWPVIETSGRLIQLLLHQPDFKVGQRPVAIERDITDRRKGHNGN